MKIIDVDGVPAEISPLVEALDQMITDLDAAYARERRFVSDASHELRNPLASLLINVDNAIEESRDAESIESLQSMKISIKRLAHLVSRSYWSSVISRIRWLAGSSNGLTCIRFVAG